MAIILDGTNGISTPDVEPTGSTVPTNGLYLPAANSVGIATNSSERVRVDSSGNVGIGTSSPAQKLHVAGSIQLDANNLVRWVASGTLYGSIAADASNNLIFYNGSANTERMRIDSSGNLLVGTTSASGLLTVSGGGNNTYLKQTSAGGYCLQTDAQANGGSYYFMNFLKNGTGISNITSNGTTISYNTGSDYRLKENVQPMAGALETVAKLRPVTWDWKPFYGEGSSQGFIAHELQAVVPDCVTGEKDAVDAEGNPQYQGVDTSFLVATLTAAIKEQQAIIEQLTTRIAALEDK